MMWGGGVPCRAGAERGSAVAGCLAGQGRDSIHLGPACAATGACTPLRAPAHTPASALLVPLHTCALLPALPHALARAHLCPPPPPHPAATRAQSSSPPASQPTTTLRSTPTSRCGARTPCRPPKHARTRAHAHARAHALSHHTCSHARARGRAHSSLVHFFSPLLFQEFRVQLELYLSEVRSQTTLPLLKQYLLLYSSIDIQVRGAKPK